ncbi:hypothetical protein ABZ725_28980 [Streptomyces sp. NPDC006872]|uniref:hypothetical protein n=1 Tax=Streptomyces sp. NPDC006872 TaxID=3155720 RepID=UPI003405FD18
MAETWDEQQLIADWFGHVCVEPAWYDGPCSGLVGIDGVAHYFQCDDVDFSRAPDECFVWPASEIPVTLEREQWGIFARRNQRYEAGTADIESHPGQGGIDARYDELEALLAPQRQAPADARRLVAEWRFDGEGRYRVDGVGHWGRWSPDR